MVNITPVRCPLKPNRGGDSVAGRIEDASGFAPVRGGIGKTGRLKTVQHFDSGINLHIGNRNAADVCECVLDFQVIVLVRECLRISRRGFLLPRRSEHRFNPRTIRGIEGFLGNVGSILGRLGRDPVRTALPTCECGSDEEQDGGDNGQLQLLILSVGLSLLQILCEVDRHAGPNMVLGRRLFLMIPRGPRCGRLLLVPISHCGVILASSPITNGSCVPAEV